jgi:hypothetical protein
VDVNKWLKVYDVLLPRSRAWTLASGKTLTKLFEGFAAAANDTLDHISSVLLEMFPYDTTYLSDWSEQFGSIIDLDEDDVAAEWAAFGGQDPEYIQDRVQSICSNCYVHEWWVPESSPVEARNPIPYIDSSLVLVNDVVYMDKNWLYVFGDGTQFESSGIEIGDYDGYTWSLKRYPCPDNEDEYPVYWYVGGETYPEYAHISPSKLRPLLRMIFKIKPVHTRVILRVIPDADEPYDIQDVYTATEPEFNTTTSATDEEIQNYS